MQTASTDAFPSEDSASPTLKLYKQHKVLGETLGVACELGRFSLWAFQSTRSLVHWATLGKVYWKCWCVVNSVHMSPEEIRQLSTSPPHPTPPHPWYSSFAHQETFSVF